MLVDCYERLGAMRVSAQQRIIQGEQ